MNAALTDRDLQVRGAALQRLVKSRDQLPQDAIDKALRLAIRDADPTLAQLALTTLARIGSGDAVAARLERLLAQRSEHQRKQAAAACIGLVERAPEKAVELLTPLLDDPSHDVRVAVLPALASAWAATHSSDTLAKMLRSAEKHAMRRLTAIAAFVVLAQTENGRAAAAAALTELAEKGPPMVRAHAKLAGGLIDGSTDGLQFLALLVP